MFPVFEVGECDSCLHVLDARYLYYEGMDWGEHGVMFDAFCSPCSRIYRAYELLGDRAFQVWRDNG